MWPDVDFSAAATPARYDPSFAANSRPVRFYRPVAVTDESTIAKLVSGYCAATALRASP